jgi:hypothetical protein
LAERPTPPPADLLRASLDAQRLTGIDPALLLTIAWIESRFHVKAKNHSSSAAGPLQFTDQTWLESVKTFGGKHGLSSLAGLISRTDNGRLIVRASGRRILALRSDPRIAVLLAAERMDYQKEIWSDSGRLPRPTDLYLMHALGVTGTTRFLEAVAARPSAPCKGVVGESAWKGAGLFGRLPQGAHTTVATAYAVISERLEVRREYFLSFLMSHFAALSGEHWQSSLLDD